MLLISMTMFEMGIIIFLQIKKNSMDDEFDRSLGRTLNMSKHNMKCRETWNFLQTTVSFLFSI